MAPQSKGERRIALILSSIPTVRDQFWIALEDIDPNLGVDEFIKAGRSDDLRKRNQLAAVERLFEELVNWMDELAERTLAESRRRNLIQKQPGPPYRQLHELGVISSALSEALEDAKDVRDLLQHGYPLSGNVAAHKVVVEFPRKLDAFLAAYAAWREQLGF